MEADTGLSQGAALGTGRPGWLDETAKFKQVQDDNFYYGGLANAKFTIRDSVTRSLMCPPLSVE